MRAGRVRPDIVLSITPADLNIVLQRIEPPAAAERYDLIIATNILVYYDVFEQSLAMTNVAKMLKPGGLLLTNSPVFELPATPMRSVGFTDVLYEQRDAGRDRVFWLTTKATKATRVGTDVSCHGDLPGCGPWREASNRLPPRYSWSASICVRTLTGA
jgi:hypothetical protein